MDEMISQDIYLTGSPQITFWKLVYRRHTNFSSEEIEQTFNGAADFGRKVTCTISRNGDLIHKVYLQAELPLMPGAGGVATNPYIDEVGHALIKSVEVEIGGQRIDRHYADWLSIWASLTVPAGQMEGYAKMIGGVIEDEKLVVYVPLQFWFCRNPGLALPLIALQYHEVRINLEFEKIDALLKDEANLMAMASKSITSASLYAQYIFLDSDERKRFAQVSHEYLIEQVQFTGAESVTSSSAKIRLNFNHPTKELIWVASKAGKVLTYEPAVKTAKLQLNGHDRFAERKGSYFKLVQPFAHHTNVPVKVSYNVTGDVLANAVVSKVADDKNIYMYSFALRPEEHQPSGSCNMSRIDNASLQLTMNAATGNSYDYTMSVFALSYNVVRILSGMAGLRVRILTGMAFLRKCKLPYPVIEPIEPKRYMQWVFGYPTEKHLDLRRVFHTMLVPSDCIPTCNCKITRSGKPLRAHCYQPKRAKAVWGQDWNLGMVKMHEIGQSACVLPIRDSRQRLNGYRFAQTMCGLKLQSIPFPKVKGSKGPIQTSLKRFLARNQVIFFKVYKSLKNRSGISRECVGVFLV